MSRLVRTLMLVPPGARSDAVLELGAYMQMTPALACLLGYGEVRGAYFGPLGQTDSKVSTIDGKEIFRCEVDLFDVERDRFPYEDGRFQTVLACEIIEHLVLDPMHMLLEIRRVLRSGGTLVLTTPNVTSFTSVSRILTQSGNPQVYSQYPNPEGEGRESESPGGVGRLRDHLSRDRAGRLLRRRGNRGVTEGERLLGRLARRADVLHRPRRAGSTGDAVSVVPVRRLNQLRSMWVHRRNAACHLPPRQPALLGITEIVPNERALEIENAVLRHQLAVLRRSAKRPRLTRLDRVFMAGASRLLPGERWSSFLVKPQTLLRWHRELVRRKWTYRKRGIPGRRPHGHRAPRPRDPHGPGEPHVGEPAHPG